MKYIVFMFPLLLIGCSTGGLNPSTLIDRLRPSSDPEQLEIPSGLITETAALPSDADLRPVARPSGGIDTPAATAEIVLPAAVRPIVTDSALGTTVASLGNPAEPGMWLKTPLVSEQRMGKVITAAGVSTELTLLPIDGPETAGSRLSLQAMQALGLSLTDLPELTVEAL